MENLFVAMFIMSLVMFCISTAFGIYIISIVKLLRNDIENPGYQNKEMKDIDKGIVKDFLMKTAVEKSKANYEFTTTSEEEIKVDNEKSIREALEEIEPISFIHDDIEHEFTIERELEFENLPFIEENEITTDQFIEDTEIIFQNTIPRIINTEEFWTLTDEERLEYGEELIRAKYKNVENVPEKSKDALIRLRERCVNKNEFMGRNEQVNITKDSNTGKFKFNFEPGIEGIYMNSQ